MMHAKYILYYSMLVLFLLKQRELFHIWKMHIVKGEDGLGIQITGGRGSKRCLLGVIITHIEEGGDIHRYY